MELIMSFVPRIHWEIYVETIWMKDKIKIDKRLSDSRKTRQGKQVQYEIHQSKPIFQKKMALSTEKTKGKKIHMKKSCKSVGYNAQNVFA